MTRTHEPANPPPWKPPRSRSSPAAAQSAGGETYAEAAIGIAAYDITGRHFGVRVVDLFGGVQTERVPSYYALSTGDPDEVAEQDQRRADEVHGIRERIERAIYLDATTVDVNAVLRVVGADLCEGFGLKVTRLGGLLPIATARYLRGTLAAAHVRWRGSIRARPRAPQRRDDAPAVVRG